MDISEYFAYMFIGRWLLCRGPQRGSRALVKWVNIGQSQNKEEDTICDRRPEHLLGERLCLIEGSMSGGPADLPALMEEVRNMADRAGEDGDDYGGGCC